MFLDCKRRVKFIKAYPNHQVWENSKWMMDVSPNSILIMFLEGYMEPAASISAQCKPKIITIFVT
jgi:hypothetical protein